MGSGKSALASALARRGATRIDADAVARDVVAAGTPGLRAIVERFGATVLRADGTLDRTALGRLAFADDAARADLNAILHPMIQRRSNDLMDAAPTGAMIVYEVPLLAETGRASEFDVVVVVQSAMDLRLDRLAARGLAPADAQARIAAQATDDERREIADELVENNGSLVDLERAADALWLRLQQRLSARRPLR